MLLVSKGIIQRAGIGSEERDRRLRRPSNIGLAHVGESPPMHRPPLSVLDGNVVVNASPFGKHCVIFCNSRAIGTALQLRIHERWVLDSGRSASDLVGGAFTLFA